MKPTPVLIAFGWSADHTKFISQAIRYMSRPKMAPWSRWALWSHMFIVFKMSDGSDVIHEALMSEGWCEKPCNLSAWKHKDPRNHVFAVRWLPIDVPAIELIYKASLAWVGTKSYATKQIVAFALAESVLGRWLGLSVESGIGEVICSEGACRLVGEIAPEWDLRRVPDQSWDSVSPQAAYDMWRKVEAGHAIADQIGMI
jgi:hypothetical protein